MQVKDKNEVKLKHPERSCFQCIRYPCMQNMNEFKCDIAKYGCRYFKIHNSISKSRSNTT